jgi:hypothetical protein
MARWSSNAATLAWARGLYGKACVESVTYWQAHGGTGLGKSKDAWGFQDIQILDDLPGVLAVQACGSDVGEHVRKMAGQVRADKLPDDPDKRKKAEADAELLAYRVRRWLVQGNRLLMVGWRDVWVQTTPKHKTRKKVPRFLEAVLTPHPPGMTLGLSDREVEWVEHEQWPPKEEFV